VATNEKIKENANPKMIEMPYGQIIAWVGQLYLSNRTERDLQQNQN
jgi:hypothetical protein